MNTITLQFCSFDSLAGTVIDYLSAGDVGHVDAVLDDGSLLGAQFQSGLGGKPSGVQIRPAGYGGMENVHRVTIDCDGADKFYDFLMLQVGKPYDTTAIEAFIADRDWRDENSWMCSELQSAALEASGFLKYPFCAPFNKITPQELFLVASVFGPMVAL